MCMCACICVCVRAHEATPNHSSTTGSICIQRSCSRITGSGEQCHLVFTGIMFRFFWLLCSCTSVTSAHDKSIYLIGYRVKKTGSEVMKLDFQFQSDLSPIITDSRV